MFALLFANAAGFEWDFEHIALAVIICAGIVGVTLVILRVMGVVIPPWIWTVIWICAAVVVGCIAVKFIASLF